MNIFNVLTMIGGLALFLYGMNELGDGLAKISGGKFEKILEKLTKNTFSAVLLGAAVTAVIQSSSATTVMVVGFVNSGIMRLSQAIGVIMGANIGTTVTAWILSLSGIRSDNVLVSLLKPSSFSPIFAAIGIIMIMAAKKEKSRDIGKTLVGFAILMMGMNTMTGAVEPLADVPEFTNLLLMFKNPVLGVLTGALITGIIQSSSASVGILQALCITGAVSYGAAIPIIMGQNIGTCVTAMLSSIGASKNAKRTALVHLYFNIIGSVVFLILFYTLNAFLHFSFLQDSANAAGIAVVHTSFNIFATLLLLPFKNQLEKLAYLTIRDTKEESAKNGVLELLDNRFLDTPSIATEQCMKVAKEMADETAKALKAAMGQIWDYKNEVSDNIIEIENNIDKYEEALGQYLVKLSGRSLSEKDSQTVSILLQTIGDVERMSDYAVMIDDSAKEKIDKSLEFSWDAMSELKLLANKLEEMIDASYKLYENTDVQLAKQIEPMEKKIDDYNTEVKKRHIKRLRNGQCTIELGFILSDIMTSIDHVADHCVNIADCIIQSM